MITRDDLTKRFGEAELIRLTDREHYQHINEDVLKAAILDAEAEAKSYLRAAGLSDAIVHTAPILKIKVCDMARYYLHQDGVTTVVEARYQQAISFLKEVVKNPRLLKIGPEPSPSALSGIAIAPASVLA
ncbi:MAG: DUF1320 domain-containing protein [Cardiobacteriaceae bacterium]|nr:DUF1320 domain-containing protein [Cardiobacteriaceae bacterium]